MRIENLSSIDMMETIVRLGGPPKDWGVQNLFLFVMSVRVFAFNIAVQLLIETGPLISVGPYTARNEKFVCAKKEPTHSTQRARGKTENSTQRHSK